MSLEDQIEAGEGTSAEPEGKLLGKFDNPEALAEAYRNLEKRLGSAINIPGEGASSEETSEFYQKLGKPTSVEGYEVPKSLESWGEDARRVAYEANMTGPQWRAFVKAQEIAQEEAEKQSTARMESGESEIKARYGTGYDQNLELARRGVQVAQKDNDILSTALDSLDLRDPEVFELFKVIGGLMADDSAPAGGIVSGGGVGGNSLESAVRLREIMLTGSFINKFDPEHEKITVEYWKLYKGLIADGYTGLDDPRLQPENPFE